QPLFRAACTLLPGRVNSWPWIAAPAPVLSGWRSMTHSGHGFHQQSFTGAQPLVLRADDKLFAHVWLDPTDPPKSVMMQWRDDGGEHRAYWGDDVRQRAGLANSPNDRRVGELPAPGEWTRLEVNAAAIGLTAGAKLTGWGFVQYDGTAYYD